MSDGQPLETEIKLCLPSLEGWGTRLESAGFRRVAEPALETSVLWDRQGELRRSGSALRLRRFAGTATLTWKGPRREDPRYKIRPELETALQDPEALAGILRALGFAPVMTLEKRRGVWHRGDLLICLDEAPFGCFLELEGPPEALPGALRELDLEAYPVESRSYPELQEAHGNRAPGVAIPSAEG